MSTKARAIADLLDANNDVKAANLDNVLTDLVADTTPQLGGDLDGNGSTVDLSSNTESLGLPKGTTAQRPSASATEGHIRYNTDNDLIYYSDGTSWRKISSTTVNFTSLTGNIFSGAASTLSIAGSGFGISLTVNFTQSSDSINTNVSVTPSSDTAATVTVPAAVYNNVTAGNVVNVTITNADGNTASQTTTAAALPSGGTKTTFGSYTLHVFTSSGTFVNTAAVSSIDVMLVAGGGAGGMAATSNYGGGGGAGGLVYKTNHTVTSQSYSISIGSGGSGQDGNDRGNNGGNTTGFSMTAIGGGGGGSQGGTTTGKDGGCGGGGGYTTGSNNKGSATQGSQSGDSGTYGFGFDGATGTSGSTTPSGPNAGGGGGGAGAAGVAGTHSQPPNGGAGKDMSAIFGTSYGESGFFSGGGAGSNQSGYADPVGGNGGGGNGDNYNASANVTAGTANTGGGGGAGTSAVSGKAGGSGICIIRYQL